MVGESSICADFAPNEKVDPLFDGFGATAPAADVEAWSMAPKLNAGFDGVLVGSVTLLVSDVEAAPKLKAGFETGAGDALLEPANKLANGFVAFFSGSGVSGLSGDWLRCSVVAGCGVVVGGPNNEDAGVVSPLFTSKPVKDGLDAGGCCI